MTEIEEAMRSAGKKLAVVPDSVQVEVREGEGERLVAILEFEMRRAAQYKVVGDIAAAVKDSAWTFYEDITVRFP